MVNLKKCNIVAKKLSDLWDEGMPLGNGKIGGLFYDKDGLRLSVDRIDLWDNRPNPATLEKGFTYKNMVKLIKSGKEEDWKEYARLFDDIYSSTPYPSKISPGRFEIDLKNREENISSIIDIKRAILNLDAGKGSKIEAFLSATKFIGVVKIWGEFDIKIRIPDYISGANDKEFDKQFTSGRIEYDKGFDYPKTTIIEKDDFIYYRQQTKTELEYGLVSLLKNKGDYSELYFTVATSEDYNEDFIEKAKEELLSAYNLGYDILKKEHILWWKNYWKKSSIDLKDDMIEKTYYKSMYLFASTSRKGYYPLPLQGVWTADDDMLPPWKGDYHHDTNTQLSYQAYLKANRLDEGRTFVDYMWKYRPAFKKFAKEFHGVKGLIIPGVSSLDGKALGGWPQYAMSPTMAIWSAQSFDEHYIYTGDEKFLKTRCYPFLKDLGIAFSGILEEKDGKLYLPLSTSPEIYDNTRKAYLEPNTNFDLALLRYLYSTLIKYAKQLGKILDQEKFEKILNKLDDLHISEDNVLMLDKNQKLAITHRHLSHIMAVYPLHLLNYDTEDNKKIINATILDLERLGMGKWCGFTYTMMAQLYAMAKMGNSAYEKVWQFARCVVAENGFHLNSDYKRYGYFSGHGRPFTMEGSFAFCDSIHEMLMQDHLGYLDLFPATPIDWQEKEIAFTNLRSIGGLLVSAKKKGDKVYGVKLKTNKQLNVKIKNVFGKDSIIVKDKTGEYVVNAVDGYFDLRLNKGEYKII